MRLSDYLRDDLVVQSLEAGGTRDALQALGERLSEAADRTSTQEIVQALWSREEAHTTVLGEGVAVPHATLSSLSRMLLMVARASPPVPFGPQEAPPVDLFFVLLSPTGGEREHIKLLARICRLVRHPGFLDSLRAAPDDEELMRALREADAEHV
jgi:PTS system nitrogen regulatory IIA component